MLQYYLNGNMHMLPLTMVMTLGHNQHDREIAHSLMIHNGFLLQLNPMLWMYLKGL
jgi:hypothetical protein